MARKLPFRIKFYCSSPHPWTLLANLSSSKPRLVCGGHNAVSRGLYLIDVLIAMAENPDDVARIIFGNSNRFKYMRLFYLTGCARRSGGKRNITGDRGTQLIGIDVGKLECGTTGNDCGISGDPAEAQLLRCKPLKQPAYEQPAVAMIILKAGTCYLGGSPEASYQRNRFGTGTDRILLATAMLQRRGFRRMGPDKERADSHWAIAFVR